MAAETRIRLVKKFAKMTVVRLFLHFFDSQRRHDDRMPCTMHLFCFFSLRTMACHGDTLHSSIQCCPKYWAWVLK